MVLSGLVTAWRFAGWPTSRSPSSVKATIEGVVRMPSAFSMTFGVLPSMTATHELVVPRSMPMTLPMVLTSSLLRQVGRVLFGTQGEIPLYPRAAAAPPYAPRMPKSGKLLSVRMTNCGPLGWVTDEAGYRYQPLHPETGQAWPPMPSMVIEAW